MTRKSLIVLIALSAVAGAAPAFAQPAGTSAIALGQRPIRRPEVVAFVARQFAEMDSNHDHRVTPDEFEAFRARQAGRPDAGLGHVGGHWFEKTDADGDGRVTLDEAQARPLQMFDMADLNHDGVASLEEQSMAAMFMK